MNTPTTSVADHECEVLIVGGGPAGLAASMLLASHGIAFAG